jgi:hypothetical protein
MRCEILPPFAAWFRPRPLDWTRVDTGRTGPDLTFGPVHWTLTEIRSTGQTGHWTDPGQSSGRNG